MDHTPYLYGNDWSTGFRYLERPRGVFSRDESTAQPATLLQLSINKLFDSPLGCSYTSVTITMTCEKLTTLLRVILEIRVTKIQNMSKTYVQIKVDKTVSKHFAASSTRRTACPRLCVINLIWLTLPCAATTSAASISPTRRIAWSWDRSRHVTSLPGI